MISARRLLRSTSWRRRTRFNEISPVSVPEKNAEPAMPITIRNRSRRTSISAHLQKNFADTVLDDFARGGADVVEANLFAFLRQRAQLRDHPAGDGLDVRCLQRQTALFVDQFQPRLAIDE